MITDIEKILEYVYALFRKYPNRSRRHLLRKASRDLHVDYNILKQMV